MPEISDVQIDHTLFLELEFKPAIITWNRLEGRPRLEDFDRSLRAEVRDPYWMICRQWQFGEFRSEDTGSAVKAKVQVETAHINRYAPANDVARSYDDSIPLEVRVEREPLAFTLATRVQIGRHFTKLAAARWSDQIRDKYLAEYPIEAPAADSEKEAYLNSNSRAHAYHTAVMGRFVDGEKLLTAISNGDHDNFVSGLGLSTAISNDLLETASALTEWFNRLYSSPKPNENVAWRPSRLEYRFACSAPSKRAGVGQTVLLSEEYPGGHLDWPAFDIDQRDSAALKDADGAEIPEINSNLNDPISFLPAPIEYGGMPNVRWWQFEDRKTDFGQIQASTTDLALLMLAEFALIYGNDWSLVPYDLQVGSLAKVLGIVVTDVFGVRTFIRRAGTRSDEGWQHWNMYNLKNTDETAGVAPYLLLPPAIARREEGKPIESVTLTRDEMANMVFGIEEIIPGEIGKGTGGPEAAAAFSRYLWAKAKEAGYTAPAIQETGAVISYVAGTTIPENWIPFLATHLPGSDSQIRLQRGRMARIIPLAPSPTVEPRGIILRHGLDQRDPESYFIHEEEVSKAGTKVTRSFQRTRWFNGKVYTWVSRQKQTGRGQGESGLRFDQIAPIKKQ